MKRSLLLVAALAAAALPLTAAHGICPTDGPTGYGDGRGGTFEVAGKTLTLPEWPQHDGPNRYAHKAWAKTAEGGYSAEAADSNVVDCDQDGFPGDYDGGLDVAVGGAAFGYGPWADEPVCNYGHHVRNGAVFVNDVVFGSNIIVILGEDDQSGPVVFTDGNGNVVACEVSGAITPSTDWDDCLTPPAMGGGATCGSGGGDGLFWVFLPAAGMTLNGQARSSVANPPTFGTITAD